MAPEGGIGDGRRSVYRDLEVGAGAAEEAGEDGCGDDDDRDDSDEDAVLSHRLALLAPQAGQHGAENAVETKEHKVFTPSLQLIAVWKSYGVSEMRTAVVWHCISRLASASGFRAAKAREEPLVQHWTKVGVTPFCEELGAPTRPWSGRVTA
jgi:hypothetical protein